MAPIAWLLTLVSCALWLVPTTSATAAERTIELKPASMSFTNYEEPSRNYGNHPYLVFSKGMYRTYLAYAMPGLAHGESVVSASLVLDIDASMATEPGIAVVHTGANWSADTLTFSNRPSTTSEALSDPASGPTPYRDSTVEVPLDDVSGIEPSSRVSFALSYVIGGREIRVSKTNPPKLRLVVHSTPAELSPAGLPYSMADVGASPKKVFAHYFPPYPISLDNRDPSVDYYTRHYLDPAGEGGKYSSVGGLLRDRPLGRPPIAEDFRLVDAMTEVRQASAAGIDGFMINIMSWSGDNWDRTIRMAAAARQVSNGFVVVPNIDVASDADTASVSTIAAKLAEFYRYSSAYRLPDGRYALSSFKAEGRSPSWWRSVIAELQTAHGIKTAFIGVFLSMSDSRIAEFAPFSYAVGTWGARSAESIMSMPNRGVAVHAAGLKYLMPVVAQDVRHVWLNYAEASNTETLRASWARAISDGADLVQAVSWNDYSESTQLAPSIAHGRSFLDVSGYYLTRFKQGSYPSLTGDELVVTHRTQKVGTQPTLQTATMTSTLAGSTTPPRDTVEVLAMLKQPATVTLKVGTRTTSFSLPAGVSTRLVPLGYGTVSASAVRDGKVVAQVTSGKSVLSSISYWDLQYYGASSRE